MAAAQLCLDHPGAGLMTMGHCPQPASQASVRGMEGTGALRSARLAAGDDHALAEVFDQLAPSVYGGALGVLGNGSAAQDVVQDVFVELWRHPDRYNPAAGSLRTYLVVLARHRAVDLLRSELRRVARQERHYRLTPAEPPGTAGDEVMAAETASVVRAAVQLLPDGQGLVGHLTGVEHDTHRALAGDPAVADAEHVESTQGSAVRQADRSPAQTLHEWRLAADHTLELVRGAGADPAAGGDTDRIAV